MGRHGDETRQRGVAGWLIGSVVAAVVVTALAVTYFLFLRSDSGSGTVDTSCTGSVRVEIAAGSAAPAAEAAADAFNTTGPTARGTCLTAHVSAVASTQVATSLIAGWAGQANPEPAVWLPDNAADLAAVQKSAPAVVAGVNDTVIARSPVVLAVAGAGAPSAAPFSWSDLITGATPVEVPGGGPLTLALGDPRVDPASGYALESMLAGNNGAGTDAITTAEVGVAADRLAALTRASTVSSSGVDLLAALSGGSSGFTAVPVLESTLAQYIAGTGAALRAVYPTGPTGGDQLTAVALAASWVDVTQVEGAAQFVAFLTSAPGRSALAGAGLRLPSGDTVAAPTSTGGVDLGRPVTPLPAAGADVLTALADAMGLPAVGATAAGTATTDSTLTGPTLTDPTSTGPADDVPSDSSTTPAPSG